MKRTFSLFLAVATIAALCAFTVSCANITVGLTLPSVVSTQQTLIPGTTAASTTASATNKTKRTTATTKITDISERLPSPQNIKKITYLDFRPEMNKWTDRDESGNLLYTYFSDNQMIQENGIYYFPHAIYLQENSYNKNLEFNFQQNGELLKLTATDAENPGIAFKFAFLKTYNIGIEDNGNIQFVKIRFKNKSSATKLTFMSSNESYSAGRLDQRVRATIEIEPNSSEWQTITFNMYDEVFNTSGLYNWNSFIKEFGIFPFGFGEDCEAYAGAAMEIDYVVLGSYDYVTSY